LKIHTHQHLAKKDGKIFSHSIIYMGLVEYIGL
jgi:hypothetical protein